MVAVLGGEVSTGRIRIIYCGVILSCEEAHDLRRAREWTTALTEWCEGQPDMVAFTGRCLVDRVQIMRLDGSWQEAMEEAHRAAGCSLEGENPAAAAEAHYQRERSHRLRGELRRPRRPSRWQVRHGRAPQPGWPCSDLPKATREGRGSGDPQGGLGGG